ncbi:Nramp family divalent metal transporter [Pelagerythrobacter rhizovicinus]|uniref:Divalent metal cation transporter n=1 Tax=Pelagerythrobacter rhizovicinus TaxID=2268576 RepID=A0A4Q2KMJ1_9SPHN|nr:Nramp family divalent metal transporter [Pelagerythrobacter rhizovicinus]RXZ66555.1 divalent metal cation transporter [Pelagerythrobacter rhizovicinus]
MPAGDRERNEGSDEGTPAPPPRSGRWKLIGPGIVAAATGVGAGDLVATLVAGSRFGYALLWAAVLGCIVKIALSEGAARYHLATESTIFDGWRSLGPWTSWYFGIYIVVWGFIYGATAMSATALPLAVLLPILPLPAWAVIAGVTSFLFVALNRYETFERVMKVLVAVMFVVITGLAVLVAPRLGDILGGLVPSLPEGSVFYTLGLIGGVGGTITTAAYGYWVNAKGWQGPAWIPMMRLDNYVAYIITGLFVVAMLIVGAELLHSAQIALAAGDRGLLNLSDVLEDRFGRVIAIAFLVGFAATAMSSLFGVWHGVSLLFSDFVEHLRGQTERSERPERNWPFRAYLAWLTFPPMLLLFFDEPFLLVIVYGVVGAFFMPFLAVTLLLLLNSERVPAHDRSGWLSNGVLTVSALLFLVLCFQQLWSFFAA